MKEMPELFTNSTGSHFSISEIVKEIISFMQQVPEKKYKITIGTDSELLASKDADFVSAVVVCRVGNGGRYFWRRGTLGKFHTLRDRMIRETLISIEVAQKILENLQKLGSMKLDWDFEIHLDVGEKGDTKAVIQEVVGMVKAYNLEPRIKPLSYAASNVADRHV